MLRPQRLALWWSVQAFSACLLCFYFAYGCDGSQLDNEKLAIKCTSPPCNVDNTMTAETGSQVHLECETSSSQPVSQPVFWFHESLDGVVNKIDCSATIQVHCSISGGFSQDFVLRTVSSSNQGKYWCCYSNCESKSDVLSLTVSNAQIAPSRLPGKGMVTPGVQSSSLLRKSSTTSPTTDTIGSMSVHPVVVTSSTSAHAPTIQVSETTTEANIMPDNTRQPDITTAHVESNPRPTLQEPRVYFSSNDGNGNTLSVAGIIGLCFGLLGVVILVAVLIIVVVSCRNGRSAANSSGTTLNESSDSSDSTCTDGANRRQPQPQPATSEQLAGVEHRIMARIDEAVDDIQDSDGQRQRESDV